MLSLPPSTSDAMRTCAIELFVGPYRSGKTRAILARVVAHCLAHPEQGAIVVVPSDRYRKLLESRLAELYEEQTGEVKFSGFLGLKIETFYQCCEQLLRRFDHFEKVVPEMIRPALVALVIAKLRSENKLQSIEPILNFPGTPAAVLSLLDELQRSGLSPDEVLARLAKSFATTSRHHELAGVYEHYWDTLDSMGYIDRRRLANKLISVVTQPRVKNKRPLGMIAFDGFDRLNPLQLKTIDALSHCAQRLLISFDYVDANSDDSSEYQWKNSSYEQLRTIIGSRTETIEFTRTRRQGDEGTRIEQFLAPDRYFEMMEIARRIKLAVSGQPEKLKQHLVVARSLTRYRNAAEAAFHDAGLDFFIDEPVDLKALPIIQFLLKGLSLSFNNFLRQDVIFCLRSRYFKHSTFGLSENSVEAVDRLSRSKVVVAGSGQWQQSLSEGAEPSYWRGLKTVFDTVSPGTAHGTAEEFVVWVENVLDAILISPDQLPFFDPFEHWEQENALAQFRKALAALVKEQELLERLKEQGRFSFEHFFAKLEKLVDNSNFRRQPRSKHYVLICGAELAPNRIFEEVYIAGLSEGEFPQRINQSGFTSNEEVGNWLSAGVDIHNPRLHPGFETALFKSLIERARKRALLSCSIADMSGAELTPSFLFNQATEAKDGEIPFVQPLEALQKAPNSARTAIASWLWCANDLALPPALEHDSRIAALVSNLKEPIAVACHRMAGGAESVLNGYLSDLVATGAITVAMPQYWSASSLSDYGKCPFRFWVSNILKIRPLAEPEEGISRQLIGQTYHKALELFYKEVIARGLSMKQGREEELLALLDRAADDAIAWLEQNPEFRKDEFFDHSRKEIKFRLNRFLIEERARALADDEEFLPLMAEVKFGFDHLESYPPLKLTSGDRQILIRGQVDRVDMVAGTESHPRLQVIDYKTGSTSISKADARSGRNLQLPLYALAVERSIVPQGTVAKAEYLSVAAAKSVGKLDFEKAKAGGRYEPVDLLAETVDNISEFVTSVQRGDFGVRPNGYQVCQACDHRMLCRISELPQANSQENDGEYEAN